MATAAAARDMKAPQRKSVVELAALSAVSALGCVVAAGRAELLFRRSLWDGQDSCDYQGATTFMLRRMLSHVN